MPFFRSPVEGPDSPAPPLNIQGSGELRASLQTSQGEILTRLFEKETPRTVANFVALAMGQVEWTRPDGLRSREPLYEGTTFHRVIPDLMIQGGDPSGKGSGGPGWRFHDEILRALRHDQPGRLSMANAGPHTNGSQFFITEAPAPWLDGRHTIFGELISGLDVVARIARAGNGNTVLSRVIVSRASS